MTIPEQPANSTEACFEKAMASVPSSLTEEQRAEVLDLVRRQFGLPDRGPEPEYVPVPPGAAAGRWVWDIEEDRWRRSLSWSVEEIPGTDIEVGVVGDQYADGTFTREVVLSDDATYQALCRHTASALADILNTAANLVAKAEAEAEPE